MAPNGIAKGDLGEGFRTQLKDLAPFHDAYERVRTDVRSRMGNPIEILKGLYPLGSRLGTHSGGVGRSIPAVGQSGGRGARFSGLVCNECDTCVP